MRGRGATLTTEFMAVQSMFSSFKGKAVALVAAAFLISGCDDPEGARRALTAWGFTDIETLGPAYFGCDRHDYFNTQFRAKNAAGQTVTGVVCSGGGWGKRSTVRLD